MSNIGLIIKREYMRRLSKKSFLIFTLLMPFLFAAIIFVPLWLSQIQSGEKHDVAIIDATGKYAPLFTDTESYHFISSTAPLDSLRQHPSEDLFAVIHITDDLLKDPSAAVVYSTKQVPENFNRIVNDVLSKKMEQDKILSYNIPNLKNIIDESKINFSIQNIKWNEDGSEQATSSLASMISGLSLTVFIYMFILIYGSMVMQGVMEEKTNRIVELMISSVKPFDLMIGKIIGIGLVGLTQLFIWCVMIFAILMGAGLLMGGGVDAGSLMNGVHGVEAMKAAGSGADNGLYIALMSINYRAILICFILYFIGGYLMYASIFAAIGASVDNQEDSSQFMIPITILLVFALYAGIYSVDNPDGPLAFWCSLIPFTSPIVMMVRVTFDAPLWQHILSILILYGTAFSMMMVSGKIYRVGILMYGKKPSLKEIIKWIKFK